MCTCMYTCISVCKCVYIYVYIYIYIYICTRIHMLVDAAASFLLPSLPCFPPSRAPRFPCALAPSPAAAAAAAAPDCYPM